MCKLSVKTVSLLAFFVTALCGPVVVLAQTYPTKPIKLIVPFPPGGALDSVARAMVDPLKERLGQPVIIDNRPGAGARLATEVVVRSPGDGYTILITTPASTTVAPALIPNLSYPYDRFNPNCSGVGDSECNACARGAEYKNSAGIHKLGEGQERGNFVRYIRGWVCRSLSWGILQTNHKSANGGDSL